MSLQGSFETIALPDVMALLAASNKTGELRVVGGQVEGRLWLDNGQLVGSKVGKAQGLVDSIFELLRLTEGNFVFKDGVTAPESGEAAPIDGVVREAEERLKEWHAITEVVPTVEHRVTLIPELPTAEITLSAQDWHLVMAVALAGTVQGVIEELHLGQFEACRGIRRLVDGGLVTVEPPRVRPSTPHRVARRGTGSGPADHGTVPSANGGAPSATAPSRVPAPVVAAAASVPTAPNALLAALAASSLSRPVTDSVSPVRALPSQYEPLDDALPFEFQHDADFGSESDDDWQHSVTHGFETEDDVPMPVAVGLEPQSSTARFALPAQSVKGEPSPEALRRRRARRQAAAAGEVRPSDSDSDEAHHDIAHDTDSGGEPINRGMLLKFLSSVRS